MEAFIVIFICLAMLWVLYLIVKEFYKAA